MPAFPSVPPGAATTIDDFNYKSETMETWVFFRSSERQLVKYCVRSIRAGGASRRFFGLTDGKER
jgi:hypothetical protein